MDLVKFSEDATSEVFQYFPKYNDIISSNMYYTFEKTIEKEVSVAEKDLRVIV